MEDPNVDELLAKVEQEAAEKLPGIVVHKELELELDLGNLLALDRHPPDGAAPCWALGQGLAADPGAGQHAAAHQPAAGSSAWGRPPHGRPVRQADSGQEGPRVQEQAEPTAEPGLSDTQGPDAQLSRPHPPGHQRKEELARAMQVAKGSTASVGPFQESLPQEKAPRGHRQEEDISAPLETFQLALFLSCSYFES
ncbi:hypothetical protein NN561_019065 [Cricetulus griseus]